MKLHWSVKRGGIIVKTYKEHLLTLKWSDSKTILFMCFKSFFSVLPLCCVLNLSQGFDIVNIVCDGITWETVDKMEIFRCIIFVSWVFIMERKSTDKRVFQWKKIFSAANHCCQPFLLVSALSGIVMEIACSHSSRKVKTCQRLWNTITNCFMSRVIRWNHWS